MSRVVDHTALTEFAEGGQFLRAVASQYTRTRHIIVIPAPCLIPARQATGDPTALRWLLSLSSVVKTVTFDAETAIEVGAVPMPGQSRLGEQLEQADMLHWLLVAPVVWASQQLQMPVLTHDPVLYEPYGINAQKMP
jgi:hypothetical protein